MSEYIRLNGGKAWGLRVRTCVCVENFDSKEQHFMNMDARIDAFLLVSGAAQCLYVFAAACNVAEMVCLQDALKPVRRMTK